MKCLILAAGYATRLYPLTENFPKPLLEVGGKTILDWLIEDIDSLGLIDEYVVISNHKFANIFAQWAKNKSQKIIVVDDGTSTNETRLGAVCDIQYAVNQLKIDDDCLVIAGDNLLDFSLTDFVRYALGKNASAVMRYYEPTAAKLQKSGVLTIDGTDRVLEMQEKPATPNSNWCCPPFYFYIKEDIKKIQQAINDGCGIDAPGSLVAWMCKQNLVYAMEMPGKRYDIGDVKSYEAVCEIYRGINK
jgi:glucose-1-phosphate thymidylyltransferase